MELRSQSEAERYLLATLGQEAGTKILQMGLEVEDLDERLHWYEGCLRFHADQDATILRDKLLFRVPPVSVIQFVEDDFYLGKAGTLYPTIIRELEELNSGRYVESVLTGGIGSGKTTLALYTQAYQLYLLSLLREPHRLYGLDPSSEILLIFQNMTERLARGVDYQRFRDMIHNSPYFQKYFPFDKSLDSKLVFERRIEVMPVSGASTAAIGQNVMGGIIDELNYMAINEKSVRSVDGGTYDQAVEIYNSIARRRKSRFASSGTLPGILCLVSSKRYPGQFTDRKQEEALTDPTIYVFDKRVWEVKPEGTFGAGRFRVFIGDETRKPRILKEHEEVADVDAGLVDEIPHEFRREFEVDIINALREIAGKSTLARHPFIVDIDSISPCFGTHESILSRDEVDFVSSQLKVYPDRFWSPDIPRFAHIDLGITGDSAGVAIGTVSGFMDVQRDSVDGIEKPIIEKLPIIRFDLVLEVRPPKNGEIQFWKIRQLLYTLRNLGLKVRWVTFDTFQSTDSMQLLRNQGFLADVCSMDTTTVPYDFAKSALYEHRVRCPSHPKLARELASLERDPKKGKIDHPPGGSKDCADAMAGVIYGLTRRREIWGLYGIPVNMIPPSILSKLQNPKAEEPTGGHEVRAVR